MKKIIVISIICLLFLTNTLVYAFDLNSVIGGGNNFANGAIASAGNVDNQFSGLIKGLSQAGLAIGTIIAIVVGIIIAIRFMSQGASGKAELKEALTPYIIACVVLFGAFTLWTITVNIMQGTFNGTGGGAGGPGGAGPATPTPTVPPVTPTPPHAPTGGVGEDQVISIIGEFTSGQIKIRVDKSSKTITTYNWDDYDLNSKRTFQDYIDILVNEYHYSWVSY